jgi:hypothetical protein
MMPQTALPTAEADIEDRSMRVVEYAMAAVAVVVAGILAILR